jgi:hypothetical protein
MRRITREEARPQWNQNLSARGWQKGKIAHLMFDYDADVHGKTKYWPAPGWPTIAGPDDTADRDDYEQLQASLLQQGEIYSKKRSGSRSGVPSPQQTSFQRYRR